MLRVIHPRKLKRKNRFGLTRPECRGMRILRKAGWSYADLATQYGVDTDAVRFILATNFFADMFYES